MQTVWGKSLFSSPLIHWINRAYATESGVRVDLTLSGFTVRAARLTVKYRVSEPLYTAVVMGEDYRKVYLEGEGSVTLFEGETPTDLSFVKLTEQKHGALEILSLTGELYPPSKNDRPLITFYGDSITCGYGVEGAEGEPFQKETENPLLGFAYTACKQCNADYEIFSYSGISVSEKIWVPEYTLGELCFGYSMYNRNPYTPKRASDVVVVNIGTNDGCAILENQGTAEGLAKGLTEYCREVRRRHPNAVMVLGYGFMDKVPAQREAVEHTVKVLRAEFGPSVYALSFPRDTAGANGHPSWRAQVQGGKLLAEFLQKVL